MRVFGIDPQTIQRRGMPNVGHAAKEGDTHDVVPVFGRIERFIKAHSVTRESMARECKAAGRAFVLHQFVQHIEIRAELRLHFAAGSQGIHAITRGNG